MTDKKKASTRKKKDGNQLVDRASMENSLAKLCCEYLLEKMRQLTGIELHSREEEQNASAKLDSADWVRYRLNGDAQGSIVVGISVDTLRQLSRLMQLATEEEATEDRTGEKQRGVSQETAEQAVSTVIEELPKVLKKEFGWNCRLEKQLQEQKSSDISLQRKKFLTLEGGDAVLSFEVIIDLERTALKESALNSNEEEMIDMSLQNSNNTTDVVPGRANEAKRNNKNPLQGSTDVLAATPLPAAFDLLMDVELEATLRFGSRELVLEDVLALGPGDVVEMDRHMTEPVDLIIGDKIVARGEVVLVNGSFGLRVTEVAAPQLRLESIRCLF